MSDVRREMIKQVEVLGEIDRVEPEAREWARPGKDGVINPAPLTLPVSDFYLTNPIARASSIMAECSRLFVGPAKSMAAE